MDEETNKGLIPNFLGFLGLNFVQVGALEDGFGEKDTCSSLDLLDKNLPCLQGLLGIIVFVRGLNNDGSSFLRRKNKRQNNDTKNGR